MPKTSLTDDELARLITSIIMEGGRRTVEELLDGCHEHDWKTLGNLMPWEKYFRKAIVYRDFDVHIKFLECDDYNVLGADIQFKRPSRFPAPYWNRNRTLVAQLLRLLDQIYSEQTRTFFGNVYAISRDEVKDEHGRQIHFDADVPCFPSSTFEEWGSECALYDEPHSSGQADPDLTPIRNDFVLIRFRRKAKVSP